MSVRSDNHLSDLDIEQEIERGSGAAVRDGKNGIQSTQQIVDKGKAGEEYEEDNTDKQPRLSFYYKSTSKSTNPNREKILDEIDKIEQLVTLNLQKINENLILSNNIISNKLIPTIGKFNKNSNKIYNNINHIKEFYENAANVNILTKNDIELQSDDNDGVNNNGNINSNNDNSLLNKDSDIINLSSDSTDLKNIQEKYKKIIDDDEEEEEEEKEEEEGKNVNLSLNTFEIGIDDESTSKQSKISNIAHSGNNNNDKETDPANKYIKDIVAGYESPPWDEPPQLESTKFSMNLRKRKLDDTNNLNESIGSLTDTLEESLNRTENDLDDQDEDEISIRFPSSPKYGGGGKLLRSEEGRQSALDYARLEMRETHPILSLQHQTLSSPTTSSASLQLLSEKRER